MAETASFFADGESYERLMGRWSRAAGEIFLDWLSLPSGLRWLDVGCGNGAFTELLVERCAPVDVQGIDPSEGQLSFARTRLVSRQAIFHQGDAQALPFTDGAFDAAVMALVVNLIPEPAKAVSEMARVVRPGGWVGAYIWDLTGGGFTLEPIRKALGEMGVPTPIYGEENSRIGKMRELWENARLEDIDIRRIDIRTTYEGFKDFWDRNAGSPNTVSKEIDALSPAKVEELKERLRAQLPTDRLGCVSYDAHANAVKGRVV